MEFLIGLNMVLSVVWFYACIDGANKLSKNHQLTRKQHFGITILIWVLMVVLTMVFTSGIGLMIGFMFN